MEIKFLQAECGDAAILRFEDDDGLHRNIMIDSGFERTFRHALDAEIRSIVSRSERIDLWIISHIHADHIGGVTKYITSVDFEELPDIVEKLLYNPPRIYELKLASKSASRAMSIAQGDRLYEYAAPKIKLPSYDITSAIPIMNISGLKLTILSPSPASLQALRTKYKLPGAPEFETEEDTTISTAVSRGQNDYYLPLESFVIQDFQEDNSIENASSIAVLLEYRSSRTLWLADAHPSNVIKTLITLGYSAQNKLRCDIVMVPHHGSKGNNSLELYEMLDCSSYVFSSNGENKYNLPSKECIARIIRNPLRDLNMPYHLYFTYDNHTLREIFANEESTLFEKYNFSVHYSQEKCLRFEI